MTQNVDLVQNNFLRFLSLKFNVERPRHSGFDGASKK